MRDTVGNVMLNSAGSGSTPQPGLRDVVVFFQRKAGTIALCVGLAIACAFLYLDHLHPVYTSSALLEVTPHTKPGTTLTEAETAETLRTVEQKIASRPVLLQVIKDHQLEDDPASGLGTRTLLDSNSNVVRWIGARVITFLETIQAKNLAAHLKGDREPHPTISPLEQITLFRTRASIQVVRGSRLISLRVADRNPQRARQLAQAVLDEYFAQSRGERLADSEGAHQLLQSEVKRVGEALRSAQEKLELYRAKHNAVSLADRQNIVVERLRELNQQVAGAKSVRVTREAEVSQMHRMANAKPEQFLGMQGIAELPEIIDLRKQRLAKEGDLAMLGQRYGPLHPTLVQAKSTVEDWRRAFENAILQATRRIQELHTGATMVEKSLEAALQEQERAALELDRIAIPYRELQREVDAHAATHKKLLEDLHQSTVSRGLISQHDLHGIDVRIVEQPLVPAQPTAPRPELLMAVFATVGLFAGCGVALGSRVMDQSITSVDAAETRFGLPVLASVPHSGHHRLNRRPIVVRYPRSLEAEAFRSLRTVLSLMHPEHARCVLFTSAAPGEGKSFCSLNCAASFTQQGLRTLLIDADLRRPSLQRIFSDQNGRPTFTDCLRDPRRFEEAIQSTPIDNLFRLGNWRYEPRSEELVAEGAMGKITEIASRLFDRVVIDSAPVVAVSDTLHIAQHASFICLVIHAAKTPARMAGRALKLLEESKHRPPMGIVLNKISGRSSADDYYCYDYYSS